MATQVTPIEGAPNAGAEPLIDDSAIDGSLPLTEEPLGEQTNTPEPEGGEPTPEAGTPEGQESTKEDGRLIPQALRALKESSPEAYKLAKANLFENKAYKSIYPTVQAARETQELLQSAGGAAGIAKLREADQVYKTASTQFLKGDPAFVKDLWEEDKIAAALHVAPMLEAYKTNDVEGYKSTVARLWDSEFEAVGLDRGLQTLHQLIQAGNKDEALQWLDSIAQWKEKISSTARRSEDPRVKTLLAERAQRHETQTQTEQANFLKEYRTETINGVVEDGGKIFDSFFKDRKMDAEDRKDLLRESFRIANAVVEKDTEFAKQRDAHLASGDRAAAQRLTRARFNRELPEAVKRVARRYGMVAGPAAKTAPAAQGQNPNGQRQAAPSDWKAVNARPTSDQIDRNATARANNGDYSGAIWAKRAVLTDGRKVSWAHLK